MFLMKSRKRGRDSTESRGKEMRENAGNLKGNFIRRWFNP